MHSHVFNTGEIEHIDPETRGIAGLWKTKIELLLINGKTYLLRPEAVLDLQRHESGCISLLGVLRVLMLSLPPIRLSEWA